MSISAGLSGSRWAVCSKICEKWCLGYGACEGQGPVTIMARPPCDDVRLGRTKAGAPHHSATGRRVSRWEGPAAGRQLVGQARLELEDERRVHAVHAAVLLNVRGISAGHGREQPGGPLQNVQGVHRIDI